MRRTNASSIAASHTRVRSSEVTVSWGYFLLTVVCACVMAAGFFLAARQHFNMMDLGMKNSKLRNQIEDLRAEKRRLTLLREISLSPAQIRKAARGLGLREKGMSEAILASAAAKPSQALGEKPETTPGGISRPTETSKTVVMSSLPDSDRSVKKIVMQRDRKVDNGVLVAALR